mgnify:CR=1 FL=1
MLFRARACLLSLAAYAGAAVLFTPPNTTTEVTVTVTVRDALAESLNTVSAEVCMGMGADVFYRYIRQFGFGRPTEVDLAHESPGIVKRPGTESWSEYDQAANSFGQGISVTPIQLISAVGAIANAV